MTPDPRWKLEGDNPPDPDEPGEDDWDDVDPEDFIEPDTDPDYDLEKALDNYEYNLEYTGGY